MGLPNVFLCYGQHALPKSVDMKANKILVLLFCFFLVGLAYPSQARQPVADTLRTHPKIVIKNSTITIGGKTVWMGDRFEEWKRVLPEGARCFASRKNITLCIWDEIGLELGSDLSDVERVEFIRVTLRHRPQILMQEQNPWAPRGVFRGELEIDGFQFDADTEFRHIGENASRDRELTCGGRYCGRPYGLFSKVAEISFRLDSGNDRGHITDFSISCDSTESCKKLIPKKGYSEGK